MKVSPPDRVSVPLDFAGMDIKDLDAEATAATTAFGVTFELISGGRHRAEPEIGGFEHAVEHGPDRVGFKLEVKWIIAIRQSRDLAKGARLGFGLIQFAHRFFETLPQLLQLLDTT